MLDRFWWPRPAERDDPGSDDDRAEASAWIRLRLSFCDEMRPPWINEEPATVMLPADAFRDIRGSVLVEGESPGGRCALVVRGERGIVFTFDPHAAVRRLLWIHAFTPRRPLRTYVPFDYHRIPPTGRLVLAKVLRLAARGSRRPRPYPAWPIEPSVEIIRWLWYRARSLGGRDEPAAPFWPEGKKYAVVLTHDVDTGLGQQNMPALAEVEEAEGFRSCWYVVGRHYPLDNRLLDALAAAGHEIGLHGDTHDNTLAFAPAPEIRRRLASCQEVVDRFSIRGFRSPSFFRTRPLLDEVARQFAYDSSVPDTMSFPVSGSGCGTIFPLSIGRLLVVPATVPPDGALLISGYDPERILDIWLRKIRWIRSVGGVAVVLTHPEPQMSARRDMVEAYRALLGQLRRDPGAWCALPHEIATHWGRRAQGLRWSPASIN